MTIPAGKKIHRILIKSPTTLSCSGKKKLGKKWVKIAKNLKSNKYLDVLYIV
jgi:hypothetical protein